MNERGDVLVFLSGLREINILVNALTTVVCMILFLCSLLPLQDVG